MEWTFLLAAFRMYCPICRKETVWVDMQCTKCTTQW